MLELSRHRSAGEGIHVQHRAVFLVAVNNQGGLRAHHTVLADSTGCDSRRRTSPKLTRYQRAIVPLTELGRRRELALGQLLQESAFLLS